MKATLLSVVAISLASTSATVHAAPAARVRLAPVTASVRLANELAGAESVDAVLVDFDRRTVRFEIKRGGEAYEILVVITRGGSVDQVVVHDDGDASARVGALTWLASAMRDARSVVRLDVDAEGSVTLITDDGTRFLAHPGQGSGESNDAVEGRWGGEWNNA